MKVLTTDTIAGNATAPRVELGEIITVHYGKALKKAERHESGEWPVYGSAGQVGRHTETLTAEPTIIIGRKGSVGEITWAPSGGWTIDTFYTTLRNGNVDLRYLYHALKASGLARHAITTSIPGISRDDIYSTLISLPPLAEQRRVAAVLDRADALRRRRRHALTLADAFLRSAFADLFDDGTGTPRWPVVPLGDIADVVSGVMKGRRFNGQATVEVPYLRVANVQDGHLNLDEIKTIRALPLDVERYQLQDGDVLLTEGGDHDKLGRGAIWRNQVEGCIHQNHVFRVRLDRQHALPEYLAGFLLTPASKDYFIRAAKRTTNLATINMTQLRGLPVPLPSLDLQRRYDELVRTTTRWRERLETSAAEANALAASITSSAFGEV